MKKNKATPAVGIQAQFNPPQKLLPPKNTELYQIQQRLSKASLYLNLLEYEFVQSTDKYLATEINDEIKNFITATVKKLIGITPEVSVNPTTGFSSTEEKALRFVAQKMLASDSKEHQRKQDLLEVEEQVHDDDDGESEKPSQPTPKLVRSLVRKSSDDNLIKRKVLITKEDGTVTEEESVSQRIVKPNPTVSNRKPPPSFEQQMAAASAAVAPLRQHLNTFNAMPMLAAVESED